MNILLDSKSCRLVKLMELLLVTKQEYIIMSDISNKLGVSLKTIQSDLAELTSYSNPNFDIEVTSKGLRRGVVTISEVLYIQSRVINDNKSIIFIKEVFLHPYQTLTDYAKQIGCSRTYLINQLEPIESYLKQHGILLTNDRQKYYFYSEDELFLRKFFAQFFSELTGFKGKVDQKTFEFVKSFYENKITIQELRYYSYYTKVSLLRENQGFELNLLCYLSKAKYDLLCESIISDGLLSKVEIAYEQILDDFPKIKKKQLFQVCGSLALDIYHTDKENLLLDKAMENKIMSFVLKKLRIYNYMEYQYAVSNMVKTFYIRYCYLKKKEMPIDILLKKFEYFEYMANKNSSKVKKINEFIIELSSIIGINLNNSYALYLVLIQIPELLNEGRKIKILVVSNNSLTHAKYIKDNIIKYQYVNEDNIDVVTTKKVIRIDTYQYDLVITNNQNIDVRSKNLFVIDDFITDDSMFNLRKIIDNIEKMTFG